MGVIDSAPGIRWEGPARHLIRGCPPGSPSAHEILGRGGTSELPALQSAGRTQNWNWRQLECRPNKSRGISGLGTGYRVQTARVPTIRLIVQRCRFGRGVGQRQSARFGSTTVFAPIGLGVGGTSLDSRFFQD
jgi:hypothetical protein